MTLAETANFLDRQQRNIEESEKSVSALGQVMVAISSLGPDPGRLLRKTARLAAQLNAQWYAVYVRTSRESAIRIDATAQRYIADTLETAQKMGGLVISLKHDNVASALIAFARVWDHARRSWPSWSPQSLPSVPSPIYDRISTSCRKSTLSSFRACCKERPRYRESGNLSRHWCQAPVDLAGPDTQAPRQLVLDREMPDIIRHLIIC